MVSIKYALPAALLAFIGATVLAFAHKPQTVHIVRTETGFRPSQVYLHTGDHVLFSSEVGDAFWPASNAHPTHGLNPSFDPRGPIPGTDSWEYIADTPGVWPFHDHLQPQFGGTLYVEGAPGEGAAKCVEIFKDATIQPECWTGEMRELLKHSIDAAFERVQELYASNPDFRRNCHDVMHVIGEAAYHEFLTTNTTADRPEASYCGFGFYHGFIDTMIVEKGAAHFEDAAAYCAGVPKSSAGIVSGRGPCYHGIGHGIFDSLDSSFWGDAKTMRREAERVCRTALQGEWERVRCDSGVYNALANALSAREYDISYDDIAGDPFSICDGITGGSLDYCYAEVVHGFLRDRQWSEEKNLAFIDAIRDPVVRTPVFRAYVETSLVRSVDHLDVPAFKSLCESQTPADAHACVAGVIAGLLKMSAPGTEAKISADFCSSLGISSVREYCLDRIAYYTQ